MKALIGIGLCAALLGGCAALPGRDGPRSVRSSSARSRNCR